MLIEIKQDVFEAGSFTTLNALLSQYTANRRYDFFVDPTELEASENYNRLDFTIREYLEEAYNQSIREAQVPSRTICQEPDHNDSNSYGLDEAYKVFNIPVFIITEHGQNDKQFILALAKHIDRSGKIEQHIDENWIDFRHGGGTSIPQELNNIKTKFNLLPKDNDSYLRCFVLMDSDKKCPEGDIAAKQNLCNQISAPPYSFCHVLEKRNAENYMPNKVLEDIGDNYASCKAWVNAYNTLTNTQKDYINLSKGFTKKGEGKTPLQSRTELAQDLQTHYASVSDNDFATLDMGLELGNFKQSFMALYTTHGEVHHDSLLERCPTDELQTIVETIKKLL